MNKRSFERKILSLVIAVSLALSMGVTAQGKTGIIPDNQAGAEMKSHRGGLKRVVEELVKEGSLSKEKGDSIIQYIDKSLEDMRKNPEAENKKHGILKEMKENKVITDEEEKLIRDRFKKIKEEKLDKKLNKLLEDKVITEKNAKDIKDYLKSYREKKKAEFERIKNLPEADRRAQMDKMKEEWKNPFDEMVEQGIITKEQKEQILKSMKHDKDHHHKKEKGKENPNNRMNPSNEKRSEEQ